MATQFAEQFMEKAGGADPYGLTLEEVAAIVFTALTGPRCEDGASRCILCAPDVLLKRTQRQPE